MALRREVLALIEFLPLERDVAVKLINQELRSDPEFDARAVRRLEANLQGQEQAWAQHLHEQGAVALVVEYESLACRLQDEVARVLAFIGQDSLAALSIPEPRLVRQADGKTLAWRKRLDAGGAPQGLP